MITLLEQAIKNLRSINPEELINDLNNALYYEDEEQYYKESIDIYKSMLHQLNSSIDHIANINIKLCTALMEAEDEYLDYRLQKNSKQNDGTNN